MMKRLTAIQLINWHYFANETIRLKGSGLLTGDNGAGKSTIFDAIQFALVADSRKVKFNSSAHDQTNRDLKGYLRCRTGRDDPAGGENQGYLRDGDFTSYVALEFFDTEKRAPFVLGVVVDTIAGEPDTPRFFRVERTLSPELFLEGNRPRSSQELGRLLRGGGLGEMYPSATAYREALLHRLGQLHPRFFALLIKALAFHPITDIRQFVYDYVLEDERVNVDAMLENFRQYRQFETLVGQTKEKLARLEAIQRKYEEKRAVEHAVAVQEYIIRRAQVERAVQQVNGHEARRRELLTDIARAQAEHEELTRQRDRLRDQLDELKAAQAANDAYRAVQGLEQEVRELNRQIADLQRAGHRLEEERRSAHASLTAILPGAGELNLPEADQALLSEVQALLAAEVNVAAPADLSAGAAALERLSETALELRLKQEQKLADRTRQERELAEKLEALRGRRMVYPANVTKLRRAIGEAFAVEVTVLCELLEVRDPRWQDAVEGYLNTQRHDLLVPPERFDEALGVYERVKRAQQIHSVRLINGAALVREHRPALPGSLAEEVLTTDPVARAYIDRLLGRLMKCETEQELKRHPLAITPTCMVYRNNAAGQIDFAVYKTPFIGARAIDRQIEQTEAELQGVQAERDACERSVKECRRIGARAKEINLGRLQEQWQAAARLPELRRLRDEKEAECRSLTAGALAELSQRITEYTGRWKDLNDLANAAEVKEKVARNQVLQVEGQLAGSQRDVERFSSDLASYAAAHPEVEEQGAARYAEERRNRSDDAIMAGFIANRNTQETRIRNLHGELVDLRVKYNNDYHFGGGSNAADNSEYEEERRRLADSELPHYEERIALAKAHAEEEFKEHFIYKLQERIQSAQTEFNNLNRVLKEIPFGQDRYQFVCTADRGNRAYYDMIMDPAAMEGFTLFSMDFRERHGQTMDDLFRLILDVPDEEQERNVRLYTDYRTYLEYDIKIHHANSETSTFSKVAREKSGGETQTPFYVAIIASFLQLYRPRANRHTLRLMMFDEAFNRMDPDRAEQTLRFINKLGLQVLVAAPIDKCEIIAPHVETTLLVMREGNRAWLEQYDQVLVSQLGDAAAEVAAAVTGDDT